MKISKSEKFREGSSGCVVEWGSETIAQQDGTANLFRHVSSVNVKMVSEKCWLHIYRLFSVLVCCALQGSLFAPDWALRQNETRKYRNETVMNMF
jgi:hypothetical protein